MNIESRLSVILNGLNINKTNFANALGVNKQGLSNYKNRPNQLPSGDFIAKMIQKYPNVNLNYFLNGEGEPFLDRITEKPITKKIPYFEVDVFAGNLSIFNEDAIAPNSFFDIPKFKGCDFACDVRGLSMFPSYSPGDIIFCKKVAEIDKIFFGEAHLVVAKSLRALKIIKQSKIESKIILVSKNPDFEDLEIEKEDLLHIFYVKGKISFNEY